MPEHDPPHDASDLDALVRRADPDRWLSSRFIGDPQARADVIAIYAFDHELARAPRVATNPLMGEIRLTWWREVLDEVFEARPVRHHPTAQALAEVVRRRELPRGPLEAMIDGRYRELDATPLSGAEALILARDTAGSAAALAAQTLDPATDLEAAATGGAAWALAWMIGRGRGGGASPDLAGARRAGRRLSIAAFPAVLHAALARPRARGRRISDLEARARVTWAAATGRV
jgi:phytoene synthase